MTYGLVYRHPANQASTATAGESTVLSSTVLPLQQPAKKASNDTKFVQQSQYSHHVLTTANESLSTPQNGATLASRYGMRARQSHQPAAVTVNIFSQASTHPSVTYEESGTVTAADPSSTLPTLSTLAPSLRLSHGHQYEVEENENSSEKKVIQERRNDDADTEAEGSRRISRSVHSSKKHKAEGGGFKHSHKYGAKHGKKQKKGSLAHHYKKANNKKKGASEHSGHKGHKHSAKKKAHKSQAKKEGKHHKGAQQGKRAKFKKKAIKKEYHKKKGYNDNYKIDKEDKIHKFWHNHKEEGEFFEFGKKNKYKHDNKKKIKEGKHKKTSKESKKKKKAGVKKSKGGKKVESGHKSHKNKKHFYHDEHKYAKKKKHAKKDSKKKKKKKT